MISEKDIEDAYKEYYKAYDECAKLEDKFTELKNKLADAKENSTTSIQLKSKVVSMQPSLNNAQRKLRLAASQIDKIRMLLDLAYIEKAATN